MLKKNKMTSKAKQIVEDMISRETEFFEKQEPGTDEYNESQERLSKLQDKLAELEKNDIKSKEEFKKFVLETVKVVGAGILLPVFGLVVITAQERDITYTSALRNLLGCFIPGKKM